MVGISCGGGSSTATSAVSTTATPESTAPETEPSVDDTTTTAASTTTVPGLSLASLPGRVALLAIDCATAVGEPSRQTMQVCLVDPDGTDLVLASDPGLDAGYPGWSNDGSVVYFVDERGTVYVNADGSGQRVRGRGEAPFPGESPDGTWVVYTPYGDPGFAIEPAGGGDRIDVVTSPDACCQIARWSPDSRSLVHTQFEPGAEVCAQLWRVDIDTLATMPLTGPGSVNEEAVLCVETDSGRWSPDGSAILFTTEDPATGTARPYVVLPDGAGLRPLVPDGVFDDPEWLLGSIAWSPDGRAVMFSAFVGISVGLYVMTPDGSTVLEVDLPAQSVAGLADIAWAPGL